MNNFSDPSFLNRQSIGATVNKVIRSVFGDKVSYPVDLFEILNMWGIPTEFIYRPQENFVAKITLTSCPKIFINTQYKKDEINLLKENKSTWHRLKFSIAHELGHYFLKTHNNPAIRERMKVNLIEPYKVNPHETNYDRIIDYQANNFAAELLMPSALMKNYLNYNNPLKKAEEISEKFDVSLTATMLRLAKLSPNIVACLQINSSSGKIEKFEFSKSFNDIRYEHNPYYALFINNGIVIPSKTASYRLLQDNTASVQGIRNSFPIDRWFSNYCGDNILYEWPYIIGYKIITFLEIEYPKELLELSR